MPALNTTLRRASRLKDPNFQPSEWHIALLRDSLIRAVYPASAYNDVKKTRRDKAERKMGVQLSFRKRVTWQYGLPSDDYQLYGSRLWNIASAGWEPNVVQHGKPKESDPPPIKVDVSGTTRHERSRGILQAAHIVPQCFGKKMFRRIFGDAYHNAAFWAPNNGLLLPRGVAAALDDWSISVVPDGNNNPQSGSLQQQTRSHRARNFKFRVINPADENLGRRITLVEGDYRTGRDLDGSRLSFPRSLRPKLNYLYFNHCCSIVKKNRGLFQDAATDRFIHKFRAAELDRMLLEGRVTEEALQNPQPFSPEYDLQAFWRGMLDDLARMDKNPKSTVLDWTMNLRYLHKIGDPSPTMQVPYQKTTRMSLDLRRKNRITF